MSASNTNVAPAGRPHDIKSRQCMDCDSAWRSNPRPCTYASVCAAKVGGRGSSRAVSPDGSPGGSPSLAAVPASTSCNSSAITSRHSGSFDEVSVCARVNCSTACCRSSRTSAQRPRQYAAKRLKPPGTECSRRSKIFSSSAESPASATTATRASHSSRCNPATVRGESVTNCKLRRARSKWPVSAYARAASKRAAVAVVSEAHSSVSSYKATSCVQRRVAASNVSFHKWTAPRASAGNGRAASSSRNASA